MGQQTLKELKEQNAADDAALEAGDLDNGEQGNEDQDGKGEDQGAQDSGDAGAGDASDQDGSQGDEEEAAGASDQAGDSANDGADDDWMNPNSEDDDAGIVDSNLGDDGKQFDDSDMASVRRKYKGKLKTKDEELKEANDEIERLKASGSQQQGGLQRPTREQFADEDDPDASFQIALTQWTMQATEQQQAHNEYQNNQKTQRKKIESETAKGVDDHYDRATELGKKSGISNDRYLQAEYSLRDSLARVYASKAIPEPQAVANSVIDRMIAVIGDGSERVMYKAGIDKKVKAEFLQIVEENPDGLAAIAYLTNLKNRLAPKAGRRSAAPKPAASPKGDKTVKAEERVMKKAYQDADKADDTQARFNARRAAKKAGYDPSKW